MARELGVTDEGVQVTEAWQRICDELRERVGDACESDIDVVEQALTFFFCRQLKVGESQ